MKRLLYFWSCLLLFGCTVLCAQAPAMLLSVNEGLSQGMVFDILQTRDGYLWIATKDGLNRYDGYRFDIFSNDSFDPFSIASSESWHLFEDSRGWIWIICPAGLDVFVPQSGRFFHVLRQQADGIIAPPLAFTETPDGKVWLTLNGKVWKIDVSPSLVEKAAKDGNAFSALPCKSIEAPGTMFTSICFTKNKKLLAGATNGLYLLDPAGATIQSKLLDKPLQIVGEDKVGQIWFNTLGDDWGWSHPKNDLWLFKDGAAKLAVESCSPDCIYRFDYDGFLWGWQATKNTIFKWNPEVLAKGGKPEIEWKIDAPFTRTPQYAPTALAFDRSGIAWLGTNGFGILKINFVKPKFTSYLPYTSQRFITEDPRGNLFTSADPNTMYPSTRLDRGMANPWFVTNPEQGADFTAFDPSGNLWGSTFSGGLSRFDAQTKAHKKFPWKALGLISNQKGQLLGVTEEGLVEFDPVAEQSRLYPFDQPQKFPPGFTSLHFLMEDATGIVWIFGLEGLIQATPVDGSYLFTYFKNNPADRSTLSNNSVLCVAEDPLRPERFLWVGTKGGGLNRLDRQTSKFLHFKKTQGLPDEVVYSILTNVSTAPSQAGSKSGYLWMSTNKGLCRMEVDSAGNPLVFKNFTVADGLQSNEFNQASYLKTRNGTMIFGGVNGLTVFHPDSLQFNEYVPQTQIVSIQINNETISNFEFRTGAVQNPKSKISLSHRQNLVTIEFAALEFTNPTQNQYRYQLIRLQTFGKNKAENWVELGYKNSVQFANLQPGSYLFKVLGSNNDGAWSEQPAVLEFTIHPPWWASWWAYLVYAFLIGAGIWFFYKYQLRQRLEHQETLRLRELDEFKTRFFTNITHEFRTPLTVILGTAEQIELKVGEEIKPKVSLIRRNGQNLLRLINQILDLAKLESHALKLNYVQGDVLPYLRYIAESLHSLANAQNVMLRVESDQTQIVMDYDPERLLQIVHNLLSNAIKFTPSGGRVTVRLNSCSAAAEREFGSTLKLTVTDTGTGIPPEDLPHIFDRFYQAGNLKKAKSGGTGIGLALTKELARAMGGDISVQSKVGEGTTISVSLPITRNALSVTLPIFDQPPPTQPTIVQPAQKQLRRAYAEKNEYCKVLIIEDNPDVVEYLTSCLSENYSLDFAYNGRAGIEKALETIPDLIISDVMMPEKDGFEVCDSLKNDERTSHVPIILLTAKADVQSRIAGLHRGADAYLSKPFHQEELLVTLANLLEVRKKLQSRYSKLVIGNWASENPSLPPSQSLPLPTDPEDAFVQKVKDIVLKRLSDSKLNVEDLCRALAMSQSQLHRKLTALTGKNTSQFIRSLRLARAKELLQNKTMNVSEVAFSVGFDDPKYFSRVFKEEFGVAPGKI
jgi:signal transduction histidine kinase/DNA-binding response OmpR family regulator/ligand-binding sensor domain-containing protein